MLKDEFCTPEGSRCIILRGGAAEWQWREGKVLQMLLRRCLWRERMPFVCDIQFLTTLIRIPTYIVADLFQGFAKIMVMCAASRFFVLPLQNTGIGVLAWSAPPLLSSC